MQISPSHKAKEHLTKADPVLAEIINALPTPQFDSTQDVFYDLVCCIIEQQIHYRARGNYLRKLLELIDHQPPSPTLLSSLSPEDFARMKISGNKYSALRALAEYWKSHELESISWTSLPPEEVKERLAPIKGVGEWTIDMILLYTLGHEDIFSPNDFQLKKAMCSAYGLAEGGGLIAQMRQHAEAWRPYRSAAVLYLLAWRNGQKSR